MRKKIKELENKNFNEDLNESVKSLRKSSYHKDQEVIVKLTEKADRLSLENE
jgi:hypothetical protein